MYVSLDLVLKRILPLQIFRGNFDRYVVVTQRFARPVTARYFRIHPVTWRSWISMRVEFYGCVVGKSIVAVVQLKML